MNQEDLEKALIASGTLEGAQAIRFIQALADTLVAALIATGDARIEGLGRFRASPTTRTLWKDPRTGLTVVKPGRTRLHYRPPDAWLGDVN